MEKADESVSSRTRDLNSWTNPRKRPRSYDPTAQLNITIDEDIRRHSDEVTDRHTPKRIRGEEWPLKMNDAAEPDGFSQPAQRKSPAPRQKRSSLLSLRPSKFVEGSMNDKVSQRPPSLYIREEEAMEQYTSANMEDLDMVFDAGIESNKPSGMFRFGKVLANAFNSVNVWHGLNGIRKEKERENQAKPERDVLKAKAELKYAELKQSGYKGTQNAPHRPESQEVPSIQNKDIDDSRRTSFRDSGVDVTGYRSSLDRKDSDKPIISTESLMPPPPMTAGLRSTSPFSDASSGRRSSLHFRKPSLEGLKRVKSQIHLPSKKRHAEAASSVPSSETSDAAGSGLRREVSKRDIAKQYKLSKKVSDLENKLDAARRQLELSIQEAPPVPDLPTRIGRKPFVPGALASLPSERLLTPQTHNGNGARNKSNEQPTSAVDAYDGNTSTDDKGDKLEDFNLKIKNESIEAGQQALWDQRAREVAARNAAARQSKALESDTEIPGVLESAARQTKASKPDPAINAVLGSDAAKVSVSKNKGGRPRKSQEIRDPSSHNSLGVHKSRPKAYAKTPQNSPMMNKDEVPPLPAKATVFDPTKVDQANIMAMRAIPDSHIPFGKAWDDMKNLRKQYPHATEFDLVAYISSQPAPKKVTDHTSVSHGDRPSSPFLGRPGSTSPMKTRARSSNRGISTPPPSVSSAKKFHRDLDMEKSPIPADPRSPEADEEADSFATDAPLKTFGKAREGPRASTDKPLPGIKREEFEWDDDVF